MDQFEEHDLAREHGASYLDYQRRVPMLVPSRWLGARPADGADSAAVN